MNPLILIYVLVSPVLAISAGINAGWSAGLCTAGTSALSLVAGGGLRASLWGDKAQKIGGFVIAAIMMFLALHFLAPSFSVRLFGFALTGQEWGWAGAIITFLFTDQKLAGVTPSIDAWFATLPPGQDIAIPASTYSDALRLYRATAQRLVGWRKEPEPQPETVDMMPLLVTLTNAQPLLNRGLTAKLNDDEGQSYDFNLPPVTCIRADRTVNGIVSVLFLAGELPMLSAWDHGLYDRGYGLITTDAELDEALADFDPDRKRDVGIPAGVRVRREGNTLIGNCLMYSFTDGFAELVVQVSADGIAALRGVETILTPEGIRLY